MNIDNVTAAVQNLYDTYPFPPDPLLDEPPPGYNWRWNWLAAYNFCTGRKPSHQDIRILDAGCGTGVGTEYLVHLNPLAKVVGIDISSGTLQVARERCSRSKADRVEFHQMSLYDVGQLPGEFDLINCVGVLHHMEDPLRGIQNLALKLAPGGLLHVFVYGELGRWEITLMQKAIALLQGNQQGNFEDGVRLGRKIFATLPENNRLLKREKERWALENYRDECFADMYVHPQEIDYNISSLRELIDASGLEFVGFSNPQFWQLERLFGRNPELLERTKDLDQWEVYRLIELLDPEVAHYEFFLSRPPLEFYNWSKDRDLLAAIPDRNPCMTGWEDGNSVFNYDYQVVRLTPEEATLLRACDGKKHLGEILDELGLSVTVGRSLLQQQLIMLTPNSKQ
jgi:SAM-dependent methyltransferase